MMKTTRRQFIETSAAMAAVPLVGPLACRPEVFTCSPSRQVLPVEIADILAKATRFVFTPRLVGEVEGRQLAHSLRREFGRIQVAAQSLSFGAEFNAHQLSWLEAFVRSGAFQIRRTNNFITLSVEL